MKPTLKIPLILSAAIASYAPQALAQLEEVMVTARKKAESLHDVPISIAVVSGESIQQQGLRDLQAVVAELPAVNLNKAGASSFVNVRGVGSGENSGFEQSVGFVADGIPLGRSRATAAALFDVQRVEILKGPQTTYFGANTIAGVMSITTVPPEVGGDYNGYALAAYETETEEYTVEGAINLPVTDTFAMRLSGRYGDSDGYIDNEFLGITFPAREDKLFRAQGLWTPTDNIDIKLKYDYVDNSSNSGLDLQLLNCISGGMAQGDCRDPDGELIETDFDYQKNSDLPGEFSELKMDSAALTANFDQGSYTLSSLTSWYDMEHEFLLDLDGSIVPVNNPLSPSRFGVNQVDTADAVNQEIRLSSPQDGNIFWEAGLFYQDEDAFFSNVVTPAFTGIPIQSGAHNGQNAETWSAFGSLSWVVGEDWTLNLGLRYIEVEKDIQQSPDVPGPIPGDGIPDADGYEPFSGEFSFETDSRKDDDWLPSIELQWAMNDDTNLYASYREGFKAGGYSLANPPRGVTEDYIQTFDPETVEAYEIGTKTFFLDGTLNINAALFYMDYKDRQVSVLADSASLSQNVENAATSTSQGIEIDFAWQLNDVLKLRGDFSFLDSEFDEFSNAPCYTGQTEELGCVDGAQDLSGEKTTFAPEYAGNLTLSWVQPMGDYLLTVEPNVYFTDEYWTISNQYPASLQDGFEKWNLRVAFGPDDYRWELAFVGRNLAEEETKVWCQGGPASPGNVFCTIDRPATYMLQGRFNF